MRRARIRAINRTGLISSDSIYSREMQFREKTRMYARSYMVCVCVCVRRQENYSCTDTTRVNRVFEYSNSYRDDVCRKRAIEGRDSRDASASADLAEFGKLECVRIYSPIARDRVH